MRGGEDRERVPVTFCRGGRRAREREKESTTGFLGSECSVAATFASFLPASLPLFSSFSLWSLFSVFLESSGLVMQLTFGRAETEQVLRLLTSCEAQREDRPMASPRLDDSVGVHPVSSGSFSPLSARQKEKNRRRGALTRLTRQEAVGAKVRVIKPNDERAIVLRINFAVR